MSLVHVFRHCLLKGLEYGFGAAFNLLCVDFYLAVEFLRAGAGGNHDSRSAQQIFHISLQFHFFLVYRTCKFLDLVKDVSGYLFLVFCRVLGLCTVFSYDSHLIGVFIESGEWIAE